MKIKAFKAAFPYTLPICMGFLLIGISYGIFMTNKGFSFIYPMVMSLIICAGSMEFVAVNLLLVPFNPIYTFILTIVVNARHIFYGISMLNKYRNCGLKKLYLIFAMCDESFSINCTVKIPNDVDKTWFMFFVTLLNHIYWFMGATIGGILGEHIIFNIKGIDFIMTALFVVIFLEQWENTKNHISSILGIVFSLVSLWIFGKEYFVIPAMISLILFLLMNKKFGEDEGRLHKE